jgi:hypothetical protein
MVTLNELIYDLWEIIRPNISDDDPFDKRQFAFWIKNQRALWLRNELNKNRTIDDNVIQDLGCVELEVADRADCCELSSGCKILRTKLTIPNTIELHNKTGLTRVAPIDKLSVPFSFVDYERAIWSGNGRYNSSQIFAFLLNDRIYLSSKSSTSLKYITHINVRGVFEDPTEAAAFSHCDNTPCYTDDSAYPVNSWMIDYMKEAILKLNVGMALQAVNDTTNNAKPDNTNESQQ